MVVTAAHSADVSVDHAAGSSVVAEATSFVARAMVEAVYVAVPVTPPAGVRVAENSASHAANDPVSHEPESKRAATPSPYPPVELSQTRA
jgi:hypothetical protein